MSHEIMQNARFLIVDDEIANVHLLEGILGQAGCVQVQSTTSAREAVPFFKEFEPDLMLLDLIMPELDGFEIMAQLQALIPPGSYLPILVLTADVTAKTKRKALASGAKDFLTKPVDRNEFLLRAGNLLETRFLHLQLHQEKQKLEAAQAEIVERLVRVVALCDAALGDEYTPHHAQRVGRVAALLAEVLGLPPAQVAMIGQAAPLHDIGRIGISGFIPLKPGSLTAEEFAIMKDHTVLGSALLSGGHSELVQMAERIALTHHERWDGNGYPQGLQGEAIPLEGRIVAVAETFDALTHSQPYRVAWTVAAAIPEIQQQSGQQFDPSIVEAFLILPHQMLV